MLRGFLLILVFQCLGEWIKSLTGIFLPGAVIGMLLLFTVLCLSHGRLNFSKEDSLPASLDKASQQLITLLPLLFMPAAAGVFFLDERFNQQWLAIGVAVVVGTALSLVFNAIVMRRCIDGETEERQ